MAGEREVLPSTIKPSNYNLSLYDLELGGAWSYQGTVKIDAEIKAETKEIVLNANKLNIHGAEVQTEAGKTEGSIKTNDVTYDEKKQRATLHFDQAIPQAHKALITITFQGTNNNDMAGFYRSRYNGDQHMFSTQFESSDARRAFPCFDEPALKASLEFEIEVPENLTALSNMPEKEIRKSKKPGLKVVVFDKSPIMSTYLFAWALGDFEYIEDFTKRKYNGKHLPVRVYTTKGLVDQGKLALDAAHKIVDFFSETFAIDYPLPKVDLLAVHEFSHGAMENWGLITYRTTALLFDPEKSSASYRTRVTYVVAHELAHMWFGNLVSPAFWDFLWLNEGFATWVGWYAVDWLHPEWNVWAAFVHEGQQTAFGLDALKNTHAVEVQVLNALEVDQIFDAISYLKGSSVIRMLANHLTPKVFLAGVSDYLSTHKYGNTVTEDLWKALSERSGQDVNAFMDSWIKKIGFPVLTVVEEPGQISVKQSRFLSSGGVKPEEDTTTWWIPLGIKSGAKNGQVQTSSLTSKQEVLRGIDEEFYKLNANQTGFYRTNLPPQRLTSLSKHLDKLSVEDKIGLIGDAAALAVSGDATTAGVLSFLEGFDKETNYIVWSEVLSALGNIRSIFADDEAISNGLRTFTLKLISPATEKIGWTFESNEDYLTGQLRALLISSAGLAGHESTVKEAQKRFDAYFSGDKNAIHPSLRLPVFKIAVKNGAKDAYLKVRKEYESTTSVDGKEITLAAMGRVATTDLARDYLEWSFSGAVATQDLHTPARALALNSAVRGEVWTFIKKNWPTIFEKLSGNMVVLERYLRMSLTKYASFEIEKDIENFFKDKDQKGFDRGLSVASDTIKGLAGYRERDGEVIKEWLEARGYK
ncbi:peptidase family M1-domain-containing protein [Elsinoe ampelina]|uniref:Aminopeptidase n=1 Tax=Elsinoe ampelina TaxID=302913 RepID=A0A6A6G1C8_9PEZI|nr:peptidase family M1-domain-containing protein [Elsinoe ampelina]